MVRCGWYDGCVEEHRTNIPLPDYARTALGVIDAAGFESWVVGGFVRDALMGRDGSDVDIATSAPWPAVKEAFEAAGFPTRDTGIKHGTVTALVNGNGIEVTTFRADGAYTDARHPESVRFVSSIREDLQRRDFTINAIAYHPERGIVDPYGGICDIRAGVIRAVGDPGKRFQEDGLRMLRACRFASQMGFSIDPATMKGMMASKKHLAKLSCERILHELNRFVTGKHVRDALMQTVDVIAGVMPELVAMKGFDQYTPYHIYDVLEHTAHVMHHTPPTRLLRWAALFHDMGKPAAFFTDDAGTGHFYGHARISVMMAEGVMRRLGMSPAFSDRVLAIVRMHDDVVEPTPKAVKRTLMRLGGDVDLFAALCDIKRADALSQAPHCHERVALADELQRIMRDVIAAGEAFSLKALAINGTRVMELGVAQGPAVGEVLQEALSAVVEGRIENTPEQLEAFVRSLVGRASKR